MSTRLARIDSFAELRARLRETKACVLIGDDDEAHREYFLAETAGCRIGICSQGDGIEPSIVDGSEYPVAWIGYNSKVVILDKDRCVKTATIQLDSVFFSFLCEMPDGSMIVVHELGAIRVNSSGKVGWSITTDVLTDFEDSGALIRLRTEEGDISVDKERGGRV
jgi:hypothetical protein